MTESIFYACVKRPWRVSWCSHDIVHKVMHCSARTQHLFRSTCILTTHDKNVCRRLGAAGNATEDVESAQNRRVSKTDISNLLRRLGKEATSSKGYFGA